MTKKTFTQVDDNLCECYQLNALQKLIIARILRFQNNNKQFFASDKELMNMLGAKKATLRDNLDVLKKQPWFTVQGKKFFHAKDKWENKRTITINVELLEQWLESV